ncbi:hypothetical protein [Anaeromyxobacter soli]|uniref:hypothetical protein n=1 Tax=Anaeromyxobacter soli TaxID=2922725 RepID=UPI001FAF1218|nr:hypothetical protein [Anaeromyxobacter sp. SG29]
MKYISNLCVFSSYLDPDGETLGDIDLGYSWAARPGVEGDDYLRAGNWDRDYLRFVKGGSAYVAMHPMSDVEGLKTPVRALITASDPDVPAFDRTLAQFFLAG